MRTVRVQNFNPRSREGSDITSEVWGNGETISIRAPARGATRTSISHQSKHINFNPRSREGSDRAVYYIIYLSRYFNPRSREGSDPRICNL